MTVGLSRMDGFGCCMRDLTNTNMNTTIAGRRINIDVGSGAGK
jgi:hypothetical protein